MGPPTQRLARYLTGVVLAVGAVKLLAGGRVRVETPPDPHTGRSSVAMDRLDLVHALCQQIPDVGTYMVRYYGAYSNRKRGALVEAREVLARGEDPSSASRPGEELLLPTDVALEEAPPPAAPGSAEALRRQAWARLIRKVFEVDPLLCPRCGVEMEIVAWITKPSVVDAILKHRREHGLVSPFEARAPPAA